MTSESDHESAHELTASLRAWRGGDASAHARLTELVYQELRRLASVRLRGEAVHHTLSPTELVSEAFVRLADAQIDWRDRAHYFAVVASTMRRVLVDHARAKSSAKRGGGQVRVTLSGLAGIGVREPIGILDMDSALRDLSELDPVQAQLVELYYFAGLTLEECGEVTGFSVATAHRRLRSARAWIHDRLDPSARDADQQ